MRVVSVNVSMPLDVFAPDGVVRTGIFKQPVAGPVTVRTLNLDGDGQADLENHGGVDKAVYAYPAEHYGIWAERLKRSPFPYGQFGENLTVAGMVETDVHIGDVYRVGGALLQVAQPRAPCYKLALKMGRPWFPREFLRSGRVGFYLRVLAEGPVQAGDAIERVEREPEILTVREASRLRYLDPEDVEGARRALRVRALPRRWREEFEARTRATP
jgi:MOSC domain-containing protein YiiM